MGFRLPKKGPDIIMKIGMALLLLGLWAMKSSRFIEAIGLPPYTFPLLLVGGLLMIFLSFIVPYGAAIPQPRRNGDDLPAEGAAYIGGPVQIVTGQELAFSRKGVAYQLRKPADQFFAAFGKPEWIDDSNAAYSGWNAENLTLEEFNQMYLAYTTSYFYSSGIEVQVDNDGLLKSVNFYPYGTSSGDMKLGEAEISTSLGISRDSRPDDVVKAYGKPSSRHTDTEPNILGKMDDNIRYRFGDQVLAFQYTDGRLENISLFWDPKGVFN